MGMPMMPAERRTACRPLTAAESRWAASDLGLRGLAALLSRDGRQRPEGLVDRAGIREDLGHIWFQHNNVGAGSVTPRILSPNAS